MALAIGARPGPHRVVVLGAGVVGLSCAHYLLERGHAVTVVERGGPDRDSCSYGNAGFISPSHIMPLPAPGMVGKALRWMADPESPVYVRPRLDPAFLAWSWRFWRNSTHEKVRRGGPILLDLTLQSRALFEELAERTENAFHLTKAGLLMLFRTEQGLREEVEVAHWAQSLGLQARVVDPAGAAELEPRLTLDVRGGVFYPLDAHVTPRKLVATLERLIVERGGEFLWNAEAVGWWDHGRRVEAVITTAGEVEADEFVIAAGSWSSQLARMLGVGIPLEPGKGYSLTLEAPREEPARCLILGEARVAITPMEHAMRVGGTMELSGLNLEVRPPRVAGIVNSLRRYLPKFGPEDFEGIPPWRGLRPCSPDGLPYVGRLARFANASIATGHAMMGVSLAPITGALIAQLLSGEKPSVDLTPLRPERYS